LVLGSHYRSKLNFTFQKLKEAEKNLEKIADFIKKLQKVKSKKQKQRAAKSLVSRTQKEFEKAMDDDFNTPRGLAAIFHLISRGNYLFDKEKLTPADARDILKLLRKIDKVFDFISWGKRKAPKIPSSIKKMVQDREKARKSKDWRLADEIRIKILNQGYQIKDTKKGPKIKAYRRW